MKLPSVWLAAVFAGGIFLSGTLVGHAAFSSRSVLILAALFLVSSFLLLWRNLPRSALILGFASWCCLGYAAAALDRASVPGNLASTLIESGKLDETATLRWRGRLRADPRALPWGTRYEINLEEVESAEGVIPISGGLAVTAYQDEKKSSTHVPARAGDRVEAFVHALPIRNFGNPGAFDRRAYLARQGIELQGSLRSTELLTVLSRPTRLTISERIARFRGLLTQNVDSLFAANPENAALARAMLLGDRGFIERDRATEYQQTGVYHVLVLAGLHVGSLLIVLLWLGRRLRLSLLSRTVLIIAVLGTYLGMVEDRPPILRAALMAAVYLASRLVYRRMDILNVAALAALGILVARPAELTDPSFVLSFAAVATIGALAVPWMKMTSEPYLRGIEQLGDVTFDAAHPPRVIQFRIEFRAAAAWLAARLPRRLPNLGEFFLVVPARTALRFWELVVMSAALQLGLIPAMAYYFHRVTLAGPFANVAAVLLTGCIVPLGLLTLAASFVSRGFAGILARVVGLFLSLLDSSVQWFAHWRRASFRIPGPPLAAIILFAVFAVALSTTIRRRVRARWQIAAALPLVAMAAIIAAYPFAPRNSRNRLEVTVLDVGQGDSLFVSFPGGRTMLVDGGGEIGSIHENGVHTGMDVGEEIVSPYLWSRGLKQVDVVALTHAHVDHLGGLGAILENFRVAELWLGRDVDIAAFHRLVSLARERGVAIRHFKQGDEFREAGVAGEFLWPEDEDEMRAAKNDDSLVLRLTDGAESLLLAGDIERPSERKLLAENQPLHVNFLKVPHHGSKTSTTDSFLEAVRPDVAAISVGRDNSFGHPSPEVLERLETAGVRVYRTDRDGAVTVTTDGRSLDVRAFLRTDK